MAELVKLRNALVAQIEANDLPVPFLDALTAFVNANSMLLEQGAAANASALESLQARVEAAEAERDEARLIVRDIHWMAVRYADGRRTYAVGMLNDALQKAYAAGWLEYAVDGAKTPQFARDGDDDEWKSITARLDAAEARLKEIADGK